MKQKLYLNVYTDSDSSIGVIVIDFGEDFTNNNQDKLKSIVVPKLIKVMSEEMGEDVTVSSIEVCSTIPISMIATIKDEDGCYSNLINLKETYLY